MPSAPIIIGTIGLIGYGFYKLFGGGKAAPDPGPPDPDTPPPPPPVDTYSGLCLDSAAAALGWNVVSIQNALSKLGHKPGFSDGVCGPKTKAAISDFQSKNAIKPIGYVNETTATALTAALGKLGIDSGEAYSATEYADGCNAGSADANASINNDADMSRDTTGRGADYRNGYIACFTKVLEARGYEIDEDGNITPKYWGPVTDEGELIIIGDTL